ncbi:hypothetical protein P7C71_g4112, partial [Lecanoromycetidae sp. Uapishka_2]
MGMAVGFLCRWEDHNHGLGQSHHCDACHKCIELHDKRHREIATIVQAIQRLDRETNTGASPLHNKTRRDKRKYNRPLVEPGESTKEVESDPELDWDEESSSTLVPEETQERKQLWNGDNRKAARDARKAAKNQIRFNVITKEEMDNIQDALHPEIRDAAERADQVPNGQGLADNATIDQNITFNSHTFKYGSLRQGIHEKKLARANNPRTPDSKTREEEQAIVEPMLASLGIRTNTFKATKERKNLYAKLHTAIMGDLEAFENEQAETMKRMAGYWRYVNRRTYNQMVRNNELWDWATGQKLPEVEEENDLDCVQEEDESESDTLDGSTPGTTPLATSSPETCYDSDFDMPHDGTPIRFGKFFGSTPWADGEHYSKTPTQATFRRPAVYMEENIDVTMDHLNNLDVPKLTIDTGFSPEVTVRTTAFGPFVNEDEDDAHSPGAGCPLDGKSKYKVKKPVTRLKLNAETPVSPAAPSPFSGTKDMRDGGKVAHNASPPKKTTILREPKAFPDIGNTIPPITTNAYNHLDHETPAPCEEKKKKEPTPLQSPVMNLVFAPKEAAVAEAGWQIKGMTGRAKKNAFPAMPVVKGAAAKKLASINAQKANALKPGAGMDYAAMAKKAVNR